MQKGMIFDIQSFSLDDGPGIRTTVFFKGCPLSCIWCHNPEGQKPEPEIIYDERKCIGCRRCTLCPHGAHSFAENAHIFDRSKCAVETKCVAVCPSGALTVSGREISVSELVAQIEKDRAFYEVSGGGVTLSGGEPLAQPAFALALLSACREKGIDTCIETSGFASESDFKKIIPLTDHIFFDLKETDDARHTEYVGAPLGLILKNLEYAAGAARDLTLRCPIIPGINDREEHFEKIAALAKEYGIKKVELKKYHPLGLVKYRSLGKEAKYTRTEYGEIDESVLLRLRASAPDTEFTI